MIFRRLRLFLGGDPALLVERSSRWPSLRKSWIAAHPHCEACGTTRGLEAHHVRPVHLFPELELDPGNLMTVCRTHHFVLCHLGDWSAWSPWAREDCYQYQGRVLARCTTRDAFPGMDRVS